MNNLTPKYFHYFLSCLLLDCVFIGSSLYFISGFKHIWLLICIWVLANFINYPRQTERRYISYYKLFLLSINQFLTFFAALGVLFVFGYFNKTQITATEILTVFSVILSRIIFIEILKLYRSKGRGFNRFYLIGDSQKMTKLKTQLLLDKRHGYMFEGMATDAGDISYIKNLIINRKLNDIYCLSGAVNNDDLAQLLLFSYKYGVDINVLTEDQSKSAEEDTDFAIDLLENNTRAFALVDKRSLFLKRVFDLLFSSFVIIFILSWVTLILGILIKIESRGPVFFIQPRAGRNGKYFNCLKFRSMTKASGHEQVVKNDARVTRVGKIIRKYSVDELPQFINVFCGQMSIVGPRPHPKTLNDQYDLTVSAYNKRLFVKPGITGLSQIRGHRGEIKDNTAMKHRVDLDLLYIKNWSIQFDILIIYKTVENIVLSKDENAY